MNILQKLSYLENNDILNKIYSYLGKHPIVEKTKLTNIITKYTLLKKDKKLYYYYVYARYNINQNEFPYFYFDYLKNERRNRRYEKRRIYKIMDSILYQIKSISNIKNHFKKYSILYYMDNSKEIVYKTTLAQRNTAYKYNKNNREKVNTIYNKYYNNNEQYRLNKIDKSKKTYYLKKECNTFLKILLE